MRRAALLSFALLAFAAALRAAPAPPSHWEPAIRAFEAADERNPPAKGQVLFVGSSTIVKWKLKVSFPDLPALNRGFGGSATADSVAFFDRLVPPYRPRLVVFYAGDNDIAAGVSPAQVLADTRAFVARLHHALPRTPLLYLSIKPSIARLNQRPSQDEANHLVRDFLADDALCRYIDTAPACLDAAGKPRPELFEKDGLHLNADGYKLLTALVAPHIADPPSRADWMKGGFGVFTHYLTGKTTSAEAWNQQVNGFDVNGLAHQLQAIGAKWYFITLGQNSGHYCAPNVAYDLYVGTKPSKCSTRDLVSDLADALQPLGVRLCVYLPAGAPNQDAAAMTGLQWHDGANRNANFQRMWEAVVREWSERWGRKVNAWWFDGAYWPDAMYRFAEAPNFASFAAAVRAGNPNALVAFNPGVLTPIVCQTENEDFTAGETNDPWGLDCQGRWVVAPMKPGEVEASPEVRRAQYHMLSFLGPWWCASPPRFKVAQIVDWTRDIVDHGGAVTWDAPIGVDGHIPAPFVEQLTALGQALAGPRSPASLQPVPPGNLAWHKPAQLLNLSGTKPLDVNSGHYFAKLGVDGDPTTFAQAGGEWPWTYQVDLLTAAKLNRVVITFGGAKGGTPDRGYATEYKVEISADGQDWFQVAHVDDGVGGTVTYKFAPRTARYVAVRALKPDGPNQPGNQMAIAELEVYGEQP